MDAHKIDLVQQSFEKVRGSPTRGATFRLIVPQYYFAMAIQGRSAGRG